MYFPFYVVVWTNIYSYNDDNGLTYIHYVGAFIYIESIHAFPYFDNGINY